MPTDPAHGVTNELLKLIPAFRQHGERLLICATNSVRSLDSAILRPGRFDYIIPVGPPDASARAAIWGQYLGATSADFVEVAAIADTRPTLTDAMLAEFDEDIAHRTRL